MEFILTGFGADFQWILS